ncbi:MAG: VanZ family protein, partial [Proteobacteria bacterium]|nr:VanZ family protein [Pseudomonadota bacterium]
YWTRYDAAFNVAAYAPLGLFLALLPRGAPVWQRIATGLAGGAALSFVMETLQAYIPPRDSDVFDLVMNSAGALVGAAIAAWVARPGTVRDGLYDLRARTVLGGRLGDVGAALLLFWLIAQMNPGIPLFGLTFDPDPLSAAAAASPRADGASLIIQAAASAFHVLGVGLFVSLLLRRPATIGLAVLSLISAALLLKLAAAAWLLKPAAWRTWVKPGVLAGIAAGALILPVAIGLPRAVRVAMCAVALLSSLLAPVLVPDLAEARAPLGLFDWHYGQLTNYNGLTRAVLLAWPVLAAAWLFALAGRPRWGLPDDSP